MTRLIAPLLALICLTTPARADLSMVGRSSVTAMGMQGVGREGLWLKHTRVRRDLIDRGKAYSHLYDLDSREVTVIDHSQRLAQVYALKSLPPEHEARVSGKDIKLEFEPTGRRQALQKWSCQEHRLHFSMPAEVGGERLAFDLAGLVWIVHDAKEEAETAAFVKAAQSPDFYLSIPALAKSAPAQARGLSEAFRRLAPQGILCGAELDLGYQGNGRMAELSRKLASRISVSYERYDASPLKDEFFAIPAGYRVVQQ